MPSDVVTIEDVTSETAVPHLSFSQLNMYLRCSMQYYFRYILGIKEPPSLAPSAGTAGHNAVEADSRRKIRTGLAMPMEEMLDYFSTTYDQITEDVVLKSGEDTGMVKDNITSSLVTYHMNLAPKIIPLMVEKSFSLDLGIENVRPVQGRIDAVTLSQRRTPIWKTNSKAQIWDNKFTMNRRTKSQAEVDTSIQLTTYDMAIEQETGKAPETVGLIHFMPPGRDATRYPAQVNVIARSPALMTPETRELRKARTAHQYQTIEAGIAAGIFIPTDNPMTCGWCGYRDRCQSAAVTTWEAAKIREDTSEPD